jgi:hypothetical protein
VREDGAYGPLVDAQQSPVEVIDPANGQPVQVQSILDLEDPNTRVYEALYGMTQEWADQLLALGVPGSLVLSYDRYTSAPDFTLDDLDAQASGTSHETFHFVLNNTVVKDNRIPPWKMSYDEARKRNALPAPPDQYGDPGPGGIYDYFDEVALDRPAGATRVEVDLLYQPTSWEYIQFLQLANNGTSAFLGDEGDNILEGWIHTGMAAPYTMASASTPLPEPGEALSLAFGLAFLTLIGRRRAARRDGRAR